MLEIWSWCLSLCLGPFAGASDWPEGQEQVGGAVKGPDMLQFLNVSVSVKTGEIKVS